MVESIVTEDAGKLPDNNVIEALQRRGSAFQHSGNARFDDDQTRHSIAARWRAIAGSAS